MLLLPPAGSGKACMLFKQRVCVVVRSDPYKDHSVWDGRGEDWDRLAVTREDNGGCFPEGVVVGKNEKWSGIGG